MCKQHTFAPARLARLALASLGQSCTLVVKGEKAESLALLSLEQPHTLVVEGETLPGAARGFC